MITIVEKLVNDNWDTFVEQLPDFDECDDTLSGSVAILEKMGYSSTEIDETCDWFRLNGGKVSGKCILLSSLKR